MIIDEIISKVKAGTVEIINEESLQGLFENKKHIVVKVGFDPTTENLHLGHVVVLRKLRQLQNLGCKIKLIIGDFTARIGDPTGKNKTRQHLSKHEIFRNYSSYSVQIFKILDYKCTDVLFNSSWFSLFNIEKFISIASLMTVSRMLERSDFKNRYNNNLSIGIHEFFYPLLQAYDSVFTKSDIEVGGIDQKFNCLLGRELQKKFNQKQQIIIMLPILIGIDGLQKMSKSIDNHVNIIDDAYNMFCKIMSIPDILIKDYFIMLGFYTLQEYMIYAKRFVRPMDLKMELASKIVLLFYDVKCCVNAKKRFIDICCNRNIPTELDKKSLLIGSEKPYLLNILYKVNFVSSLSEGKRMIKQRAVKVDGCIVEDKFFLFSLNKEYILQIGKHQFMKIFLY